MINEYDDAVRFVLRNPTPTNTRNHLVNILNLYEEQKNEIDKLKIVADSVRFYFFDQSDESEKMMLSALSGLNKDK